MNITPGEILIILVVALIVLGPEKLPDMVRKAGRLYGELRRMSSGFQSELRDAFDEPTRELRETAEMARNAVTGAVGDITSSVNEIVRPETGGYGNATTAISAAPAASAEPTAATTATAASAEPAIAATGALNGDHGMHQPVVNAELSAAIAAEAAEANWSVASQPPLASKPAPERVVAPSPSSAPAPPIPLPAPAPARPSLAPPGAASGQGPTAANGFASPASATPAPAANGFAPPSAPLPPPAAPANADTR